MGFVSANAVDALDWDFTTFGGRAGTTPEPGHPELAAFWSSWNDYVRLMRDQLDVVQKRTAAVTDEKAPGYDRTLSVEARTEAVRAIEREWDAQQIEMVEDRRKMRCGILAAVCADSPSYDDLYALPPRILDAFEKYMIAELSPKVSRTDTSG